MPSIITTIEDFSPVILYTSDWRAGTSESDGSADQYSASSFTLTQTQGGVASFTFNGTGVNIFGSKRANHGFYQIAMDGAGLSPVSGQATPDQFQVSLFNTSALPMGQHTVTLTNQGSSFVDIDFITWETAIGQDNEQLIVNTSQDTDPAFVYQPASAWGTQPINLGTFSGGSGHVTNTPGAFLTYTFKGAGISLYGPIGPNMSAYSVSVDGGPSTKFSANRLFYTPQVLLYHANNLGPGTHNVKVSYNAITSGQTLAIDYANVFTTPSIEAASGGSSGKGSLSAGSVAGIVFSVLFIVAVIILSFFYIRRRKAQRNFNEMEGGIQQVVVSSFNNQGVLATPRYDQYTRTHSAAPSVVTSYPQSDAHEVGQNTYYAASVSDDLEFSTGATVNNAGSAAAPSRLSYNSTSPRRQLVQDAKGNYSLRLPPAVGQSLAQIPEAELRANRRVVSGRAQDFGGVTTGSGLLPPDYSQATEMYGRNGRI